MDWLFAVIYILASLYFAVMAYRSGVKMGRLDGYAQAINDQDDIRKERQFRREEQGQRDKDAGNG